MNREIIDWERKGNLVKFYLGKNGEQWGDDWDDVPWEYNAGRVYDAYIEGYKILVIPFEYQIYEPQHFYSKKDLINRIVPCIIASKHHFNSFQEALRDTKAKMYYFGDKIRIISNFIDFVFKEYVQKRRKTHRRFATQTAWD